MIDEILPDALHGERLDRVVAMLDGCSRSVAAALIAPHEELRGAARPPSDRAQLQNAFATHVAPPGAYISLADPINKNAGGARRAAC